MALLAVLFVTIGVVFTSADDATPTEMPPSGNPLSSHVLDTTLGRPAPGINVTLSKQANGEWSIVNSQLTNDGGRVGHMISQEEFTEGLYRLHFDTISYYSARGEKTFYPYIELVFQIDAPSEHYHVPILITPYSYSTYRGS